MAIFTPGPAFAEIRGSIGGMTFSRNSAGQIVRQRSAPVNPNSSRQQDIRTIFASQAQRWSDTLTEAQRDAWDAYGAAVVMTNALGQPFYLSGFQHFIRSNSAILQAEGAQVDNGPTTLSLPQTDPIFNGGGEADDTLAVVFDADMEWCDLNAAHMIVSASLPYGSGRTFIGGPFRYAGVIDGNPTTPPTSPQLLTYPWVIAEGQKVLVRARIALPDGRLSQFMQSHATVAAEP